MASKIKMVWQDRGWESIRKRMTSGPAATHVRAGIMDGGDEVHGEDSELTTNEVGILQEFGSDDGHIPARSYIRRSVVWPRNLPEIRQQLAQVSRKVLFQFFTRKEAMQSVGRWAEARIKKTIESGVGPANAPETVAQKGHGLTLRDTYKLLNAIGYKIVDGTGEGED
jgi:hypothetical protein